MLVTRDLVLEPFQRKEPNDQQAQLGAIEDDKPIRLTLELPASVHRDLVAYAQALAKETGRSGSESTKLIPPTPERFIATDRAFQKVAPLWAGYEAVRKGGNRLTSTESGLLRLAP